MTTHSTEIKGHGYRTEVFKLKKLINLELQLGQLMGGAAGPGIDYLSGLFSIDRKGVHLQADADKSTDSRKLGRAFSAIPAGILELGGYDFVMRLLSRTEREVDLGGDGELSFVKLRDKHLSGDDSTWADHIYPGHLGELHLAIAWVLVVNFSPFGRGPSWNLNQLWDELQTLIPEEILPTTEESASDKSSATKTPKI